VVSDVVPAAEPTDNQGWSVVSTVGQLQTGTPGTGGQGEVSQIVRLLVAGSEDPMVHSNERETGVASRL
jgi:hypothetical protein